MRSASAFAHSAVFASKTILDLSASVMAHASIV